MRPTALVFDGNTVSATGGGFRIHHEDNHRVSDTVFSPCARCSVMKPCAWSCLWLEAFRPPARSITSSTLELGPAVVGAVLGGGATDGGQSQFGSSCAIVKLSGSCSPQNKSS